MARIYTNPLHWAEECKYISAITENSGICPKMNNDKDTFIRYCAIQQQQAEKYGFIDAAEYIQQCIDELLGSFPEAPEQKCYVL